MAVIASAGNFGLVIVGKRGRSALKDLLLGSTAEAVCRHGQRPVLLVPGDAKPPKAA